MKTALLILFGCMLASCAPIPHYAVLATKLAGRVVDDHNQPVTGAQVDYLFRGGRQLGRTTTQSDGSFSLGPFRQWFYLTYIGSPGVAPFPYTLERPAHLPDAIRISSGAATAIYLRGSSQDHESRLDDRTRRFVQLPRSPRWTPEDRTFRVGRAMRDTELPKMPAQPPSLPAKITE